MLGGAVFWSTKAVDHLNRGLISIKGFLLVITLVVLMPHVNISLLANSFGGKYIYAAAPIFLCSFGSHTVIPSISNYAGNRPKSLKWIIICGATIPLFVYAFWLTVTLGIIPLIGTNSFVALASNHGSVGEFVRTLTFLANNKLVTAGVNGFSNVAMTTSFLGVTLGLFDFLADAFKRVNTRAGRLQTSLLTFVPPLLFAIWYPKGFIIALGYAAIFVAILEIILPALMAYKLRKSPNMSTSYRVAGGNLVLFVVAILGVVFVVIQILNGLQLLPKL